MSSSQSKEELRIISRPLSRKGITAVQGRLAERVRRIPAYKRSGQVFVDPSLLLKQTRINVLLDGKELVMPAPGLKEGFYLLKPFTIPFNKLGSGVTYRGLAEYGRKVFFEDMGSLDISLLIGEAMMADGKGWRVGDGEGFFDLAAALLKEAGGLNETCRLVSALADSVNLLEEVPHDHWDVRCDIVLTPDQIVETGSPPEVPSIEWNELTMERIKRITPLWKMNRTRK